jgi:N-acetylmuramoyl-L-alanine amidase
MINLTADPGHGGKDRSNRGPNGYIEADGVLQICQYLREELLSINAFNVKLTREKDMTLSLKERANIALKFKSNMIISNHTDAGPAEAGGTTVFCSVDLPGDKIIAERFAEEISKSLGIKNRGAKTKESTVYKGEDYYGVIDYCQDGGIPHVFLIESAFHTNPKEERMLLDKEYLRKIAKAEAKVICEVYKIPYLSSPKLYPVEILASKLNCRKEPNTQSEILKQFKRGDHVTVIGETTDDWGKLKWTENGQQREGYISMIYTKPY